MKRNLLARETSPYLLQHAGNPVHWRPWGPEALAEARTEDKPILLSIGYAACHWCHVMAHESFEDPAIADLMNELFVNIKVDREERPDLDSIYQSALALTGQHGGWPLTMFLTPEAMPFWGGTYFPSQARYGRPGFPEVLRRISDSYRNQKEAVAKNRDAILAGLQQLAAPAEVEGELALGPALLDEVARHLRKNVDPVFGGIGGAPKFPQSMAFELLWRAWLRTGDAGFRTAVETTLTQMCQGGIYDHLAGGFARYSTDERWLAPHFEKMLYDNALLIELLTLVWQGTGDALYRQRVSETAGWVLAEMVAEGGGFASSLDADSEGEEGKFYVWSELEVNRALGAQAADFKRFYDVTSAGNWDGHNILNRSAGLALADAATEARLAEARAKLMAARAKRVRPGWDDKVLADWNGLTIAALAKAGWAFREAHWIGAAERAFAFVADRMSAGGRLLHSHRNGESRHAGMLDDYANMARAALALHEVTGAPAYLDRGLDWVGIADRHFLDRENGGYFIAADDARDLITRPRHCHDHALPAGNAVLAEASLRLWHLSGDDRHRDRAEAIFAAFAGELNRNFFPLAALLNAVDLALAPVDMVLLGQRGDPALERLLDTVRAVSLPNRILSVRGDGSQLPVSHPAHAMRQLDGQATAYICIGQTCSAPVTTPAALRELLPQPPAAA